MKTIRRRVQREDYARILLTETSTYDVPIIISNVGFYWHWKKLLENKSNFPVLLNRLLAGENLKSYTLPYGYKVRKDANSYRHLSLMHPRTQVAFLDFYKNFDIQLLDACSRSSFSIRYPSSIAGRYFVPGGSNPVYKYKSRAVASVRNDSRTRYLTSYFAYQSHTRLHHFFDSSEFRRLEKQFKVLWTVDIARCFDSIYTHSITWAFKNRSFAKTHRNVSNSVGALFDRLMQCSNYNETSGILIGSEVSRIFAEVILQEIDVQIEIKLEERKLFNEKDYVIKRYVDDYFIFTNSEHNAEIIRSTISDAGKEYKLSLNAGKTRKYLRPFVTAESRAIVAAKHALKRVSSHILKEDDDDRFKPRKPRYIFDRGALLNSFLQEIKASCDSPESYNVAAGYTLASTSNLLIKFCDQHLDVEFEDDREKTRYRELIFFCLELIFHLYTVSPTPNASIKMGIVIHRCCMFFETNFEDELNSIRSLIYTRANDYFVSSGFSSSAKDNENVASFEALNLLAALKCLGDEFALSQQIICSIVDTEENHIMSYFEIVTMLYYIGDDTNKIYGKIKKSVIRSLKYRLDNLNDVKEDAEKSHLLLDILSCPYVEAQLQKNLLKKLHFSISLPEPSKPELETLREKFLKHHWFTSWTISDLVNSLEKKMLLRAY